MKKGRHRRFEEARKLKQMGPESLLDLPNTRADDGDGEDDEDDEYARIAERYGVEFDDEDDEDDG